MMHVVSHLKFSQELTKLVHIVPFIEIPNLKGIVLETYGAGNAPTEEWFTSGFKKSNSKRNCILLM